MLDRIGLYLMVPVVLVVALVLSLILGPERMVRSIDVIFN